MNTANEVLAMINGWKQQGMSKADLTIKIAEACLGWSYVWGGYGQICNKSNRNSYANRSSCPEAERAVIISKCQVLRESASSCNGCKWYPGGTTRFFDCRGFTRWVLEQSCGWTLQGAGATSQWNTASNWVQKGEIANLPANTVCCLFKKVGDKMNHTGLCIGNGYAIHCSGEVKREPITSKAWTHYAIPKGIEGDVPVPTPGENMPTLRKGASGEYVTLMQTKLIQRGYDLSPYGADGKFGTKTYNALKQFQRDNGLGVDGICGKNTWNALLSGEAKLYTVTIQHVSRSVAEDIVGKFGGTMKEEG